MIREVLSRLAAVLCAAALFFLCGSVIPASLAGEEPAPEPETSVSEPAEPTEPAEPADPEVAV